jgi:hypothetical protein
MDSATPSVTRRADPYRDLLVIDRNAPRFNQTVVAVLSLTAVLAGAWPLLAAVGAQLAVAVTFGRRYCLPCVLYFEVVQPWAGEGELEDSRAPRFANVIGAVFLLAAAALWGSGFPIIGRLLGGTVAALAGLAAITGLCVGCELYRVLARLKGIRGGALERVDLQELGATAPSDELVVLFTHPLCGDCQRLGSELERGRHRVLTVDVSKHRALAKKYGVTLVPLAVAVGPDGRVHRRVR